MDSENNFIAEFENLSLLTRVADIIRDSDLPPSEAMRSFIGRTIRTRHSGRDLEYRISDVTPLPLRRLKVHRDAMTDYFRVRYGIRLQLLDYPCFVSECTNVIPLELAFVD
jgi:hypothetical protein